MSTPVSQAGLIDPPADVSKYSGWRELLADSVTDPAELCRLLGLGPSPADAAWRVPGGFPLLVPRSYLARIRPGDPEDPLLLQILPQRHELNQPPEFSTDPVGESDMARTCGILCKYRSRALIVATGACAVHCRFCFRRHFPYPKLPNPPGRWQSALERIGSDTSIREVILSGGDPLTLDDDLLSQLARRLAEIPHLRRLRVHTRVPIVIPQRVTEELLSWLRGTRLASVVVVHVNHPAEIDEQVAAALGRLVDAGVPVLSQSVLLRRINDRADVLAELFERLVDLRVMPYYLHQLDRVAGAAHFEVPEPIGVGLVEQLRARLPGYAVPRYVREEPGEPYKRPLA
ncbi:MAG: EF-P beta-lysylation protein EpmB [Planctomycetota bacterium]